jgi:peptidoglycan/LPS O-acetylase OafA/YrhL
MGLIRLLLAFTVVIAHTNPIFGNKIVGGITSVHAFFIISGFYMALILNEKYVAKGTYKLFISNRLLRLYPVYWVMLLLTIILGITAYRFSNHHPILLQPYLEAPHSLSFFSWVCLSISNITLIGQDWMMFTGLDETTGNLFFTPYHTGVWHYLVVTQSWTVGVEIMFYIIAPLLVRRSSITLIIIIVLSLLLRVIIYQMGYDNDPWTFRFLPNELAFFMAGALGYRAYVVLKTKNIPANLNLGIFIFMVGFTIFFQYIPIETVCKQWLYFILIAITTPFLFIFTKTSKLDHWIGELTYPVYMCHVFIFVILGYLNKFTGVGPRYSGLVTLLFSILFSVFLVKFVVEPVERIRQRRVKQSKYIK